MAKWSSLNRKEMIIEGILEHWEDKITKEQKYK